MSFVSNLDTPLLRLSPYENFRLKDACQGVHVFGGIGSGKTSGSGKMLLGAYLRASFGGIITAVKPGAVEDAIRDAHAHGREKSIVLFDSNEGFNFLDYELGRQGMDGIGTVTECLLRVLEAAKKTGVATSQKGEEAFWEASTRMALRYTILPLYAACGSISIADIIRFISSAPASRKDVLSAEWQQGSEMCKIIKRATTAARVPMAEDAARNCIEFWKTRWTDIPEKTRGNIVVTVGATLDRFLHGRLQRAFCGRTTLVPEMTFHGAIIVLAMPTLTWNEDGIIAQQLFKFMWQRAVLNRGGLAPPHRERPVFIFSDEAQDTVSSYDGEFLGLARDSKCCTVYLTQSLPTYYAKMGGDNPRDAAHGLVGKFMTHIYHANACPETNEYASRMIGKVMTRRANYSAGNSQSFNEGMSKGDNENSGSSSSYGSSSGQGYSFNSNSGSSSGVGNNWGDSRGRSSSDNVSRGYSESMEYVIEPGEFARILRTGGPENGGIVSGVWFQSGRVFRASGGNTMIRRFKQ